MMIAMQYAIDLPSDYDMEIIRRRVRDNGSKTDGFRDLEMKAYLVAEKGKYGNSRNQYAPFYVWRDVYGMNDFLLHGPFGNILQSFGCPQVRTWFVICKTIHKIAAPRIAYIETILIDPYSNFENLVDGEIIEANGTPDSYSFVSAYNLLDWVLCRFRMMPSEPNATTIPGGGLVYDVHHIS